MTRLRWLAAGLLLLAAVAPYSAEEKKAEDGFVPMFNGKDLTGWVNVNCAPGTFFVKDGMVITTGKPTGYLRTQKQYENFIADFEWMHVPPKPDAVGNSGFFVWADPIPAVGTGYTRGIEVQVLVNLTYTDKKTGAVTASSHGDLFSIHGATCVPERPHPTGAARCIPSENRAKGANEWNHYVVEANDGVIKLAVNGKVVSSVSKCSPRKGYLALESEGSECRFRNLKIKELPSTNPKKEEIADEDMGFTNMFTGLDLSGWKADEETKQHWTARGGVLVYDGKGKIGASVLRTEKEYGDAEFIFDVRRPKIDPADKGWSFVIRGKKEDNDGVFLGSSKESDKWRRVRVLLEGNKLRVMSASGKVEQEVPVSIPGEKGAFLLRGVGELEFRSLFVRELKK